jgi:lipocalin
LFEGNNEATIELYKKFTGNMFEYLQNKFNVKSFIGKWDQVFTSRTTGLFGTGITLTNVTADYGLNANGNISVYNSAYNQELTFINIRGESKARDPKIPCCRTVYFNDNRSIPEGDYWITYINDDFSVIVVTGPLIVAGLNISDNFAFYVLTKDRNKFWSNKTEVDKVLDYLKSKGFTNFFNKPVVSGTSIQDK